MCIFLTSTELSIINKIRQDFYLEEVMVKLRKMCINRLFLEGVLKTTLWPMISKGSLFRACSKESANLICLLRTLKGWEKNAKDSKLKKERLQVYLDWRVWHREAGTRLTRCGHLRDWLGSLCLDKPCLAFFSSS